MMKIHIASDHGGFDFKQAIVKHLAAAGHEVLDHGNRQFDPADDYPDFVIPCAAAVAADVQSRGIVLGRSGNGEAIAANKVRGVRAAVCLLEEMAKKAREHNNANVLSLGGDYVSNRQALAIVDVFLATDYSGEPRHQQRLDKIADYEAGLRIPTSTAADMAEDIDSQ